MPDVFSAHSIDLLPPRLAALHAYWSSKLCGRPMPSRSDIDPIEIPKLLPWIMLVDVQEGGANFRYRLVGSEIASHVGAALTRRTVGSAVAGPYTEWLLGVYRTAVERKKPVFSRSELGFGSRGLKRVVSRLMLPLSSDGETVSMILNGQDYTQPHDRSFVVRDYTDVSARAVVVLDQS
jgi:hypothetical protein